MATTIRVSRHRFLSNSGKENQLDSFIAEYKTLVSNIIDKVWDEGYNDYCPSKHSFSAPKFFDSTFLRTFHSTLGGMLRQTAGIQALGMLKSATDKHSKRVFMMQKLQGKRSLGPLSSKEQKALNTLQYKVNHNSLRKPGIYENFKITISRPDVVKSLNTNKGGKGFSFSEFIKLSLAGGQGTILIPLNHHKHSKKIQAVGGVRKASVITLISPTEADLIWEVPVQEKKIEGITVGCDQGITTCISLSDGQTTKENLHGWDLTKIQKRMARRVPGSKGTRRTQAHRTNYVNWSINQINFQNTKEVRLEKISQIRTGRSSSKFQKSWRYTLIKQKLERLSETEGFSLSEVPNKFRSQRCSCCGYVNKSNRKGKTFICGSCGSAADSDLNAASNLELCLPEVPHWVFEQQQNRKEGFFWTEDGVVLKEHVIPSDMKTKDILIS